MFPRVVLETVLFSRVLGGLLHYKNYNILTDSMASCFHQILKIVFFFSRDILHYQNDIILTNLNWMWAEATCQRTALMDRCISREFQARKEMQVMQFWIAIIVLNPFCGLYNESNDAKVSTEYVINTIFWRLEVGT